MLINDEKYACDACVRGHRVSSCSHSGMVSVGFEVRGKAC